MFLSKSQPKRFVDITVVNLDFSFVAGEYKQPVWVLSAYGRATVSLDNRLTANCEWKAYMNNEKPSIRFNIVKGTLFDTNMPQAERTQLALAFKTDIHQKLRDHINNLNIPKI